MRVLLWEYIGGGRSFLGGPSRGRRGREAWRVDNAAEYNELQDEQMGRVGYIRCERVRWPGAGGASLAAPDGGHFEIELWIVVRQGQCSRAVEVRG